MEMILKRAMKHKRAVFFTFLAVTLVSIMVMLYSGVPDITIYKQEDSLMSKFQVFNSFSEELKNKFIYDVLRAQSKLAVMGMLEYIESNNEPLSDVNETFTDLMFDATDPDGVLSPVMCNMKLSNYTDAIKELSMSSMKIETNITFISVFVNQSDPWHIDVYSDVSISTRRDDFFFSVNDTFSVSLPISGLKDPIYLFNDSVNIITPRMTYTEGWKARTPVWDRNSTWAMLINRSYRHTSISPSFLMRLANNTNASDCCGIESFVNASYGDFNRSYVDYLFFNNLTICSELKVYNYTNISESIEGMWFKLDEVHDALYNMTDWQDEIVCTP
ncbi:hypothetical protein JXB31_05725 [Candidatus Woesearchaeota archaeon]|nr:hypothetical protein [Candidatus Woesearchaeota archaeon]